MFFQDSPSTTAFPVRLLRKEEFEGSSCSAGLIIARNGGRCQEASHLEKQEFPLNAVGRICSEELGVTIVHDGVASYIIAVALAVVALVAIFVLLNTGTRSVLNPGLPRNRQRDRPVPNDWLKPPERASR